MTPADDGWSGTDFRRPAFQRMLQDAQDGRINLIIVKDLSRLGRNHIEVNRLTEDVFPTLGISKFGISFGGVSNDDQKLATVTMTIPPGVEDAQESLRAAAVCGGSMRRSTSL